MSTPRSASLPAGARVVKVAAPFGLLTGWAVDGSGAPLVVLPGFTGSKEDFEAVLPALAARGVGAIALDLPGQCDSAGSDDPQHSSTDSLGEQMAGVLAGIGDYHLLGHSFGGLVARAAVLGGAKPQTLTLLASGPDAIPGVRRLRLEQSVALLAEHGQEQLLTLMLAADPPPAAVADFIARRFLANTRAGLEGMAQALLSEPDRTAELVALAPRTLVVTGEKDDGWPVEQQRAMAEQLGADFALIAGAAHSPNVEAPDALADILTAHLRGGR